MENYRPQMRAPNHPLPIGDSRTPVAWRQREQNFLNNQQQQRPQSPTSTETDGTSSDVETSTSGRQYNRLLPPVYAPRTNTIRSTRSVPALTMANTFDGEPCPVHGGTLMFHGHPHPMHPHHPALHHGPPVAMYPQPPFHPMPQTMRRAGSMFDVRMGNQYASPAYSGHPMPNYVPQQPLNARTLEKKSHYGSIRSIHSIQAANGVVAVPMGQVPPLYNLPPMPPSHLLPPGMRPRPLVIPASVEPLPVRDPMKGKAGNGLPTQANMVGPNGNGKVMMDVDNEHYKKQYHCCRGPLPLVWFIISIVTIGVVLGVVLGSIYG